MQDRIREQIKLSQDVLTAMANDKELLDSIQEVVRASVVALQNGNKLLFMGNGGSAADSQHLAAEMVSRLNYNRPAVAALALTVDTSVITAIGNDFGFEHVYERQVEAIARPGDVLFGISTSGDSSNILLALKMAKKMGVVTVGMTGNKKGAITQSVDYCIEIPADRTANIQEAHIVVGHIICGMVESELFSGLG